MSSQLCGPASSAGAMRRRPERIRHRCDAHARPRIASPREPDERPTALPYNGIPVRRPRYRGRDERYPAPKEDPALALG